MGIARMFQIHGKGHGPWRSVLSREVLGAWMRDRSSGNERGMLPQGWGLRNKPTAATKAAGRTSKPQEAIHQESSLPEVTKEAASFGNRLPSSGSWNLWVFYQVGVRVRR